MLEWLVAVCAFVPLTAIYLGGMKVEPAGGRGFQQVLGLVLTMVVYLVVWRVLHTVLAGIGPILGGVILATAISILLLPLEARTGFLMVGVKLKRTETAH
jgi:membrane glycosyltransferase